MSMLASTAKPRRKFTRSLHCARHLYPEGMHMRLCRIAIAAGALGVVVLCIGTTLGLSASAPPVRTAQAQAPQAPQKNPLERARTAVETLINRLRGRDM